MKQNFHPEAIHEYIHEFGNSDASRVKGFCPIPQHRGRVAYVGRVSRAMWTKAIFIKNDLK
jgi:G3E family GTPase